MKTKPSPGEFPFSGSDQTSGAVDEQNTIFDGLDLWVPSQSENFRDNNLYPNSVAFNLQTNLWAIRTDRS